MGWQDNRNKSAKEMAQEEKLQQLRAQIREMEDKVTGYNVIQIRVQPRIRRNGVFVDTVVGKGKVSNG